MQRRSSFILIVVAASLLPGAVILAGPDAEIRLDVGHGVDSNPLELPAREGSGSFTQLALDASIVGELGPRAGIFLSAGGSGRLYESGLDDGDSTSADARAGIALVPYRNGFRRLTLALGGTWGLYRSTFIDPETGQVFAYAVDPNTTVPIAGRFDFDSTGIFLDARFRIQPAVLLTLDTEMENRVFVEDYDIDSLDPLDDRTVSIRPGLRWDVARTATIDLSIEFSERRYDALAALGEDAFEVEGTRREYRYVAYRAGLDLDPLRNLNLTFGVESTDRDDTHAGYYDSRGLSAFITTRYDLGEKTRFRLDLSNLDLRYQNAFVGADPDGARRGGDIVRIRGRAERDLTGPLTLFVEAVSERSSNEDPLYEYDRNLAHAGLTLRHKTGG